MTTASPLQGGCRRHLPRRAVHKTPRYSRKNIKPIVKISVACQCYRFFARPPAAHLTSRHATHFAVCFCKNNAPIRHRRGRMARRKSRPPRSARSVCGCRTASGQTPRRNFGSRSWRIVQKNANGTKNGYREGDGKKQKRRPANALELPFRKRRRYAVFEGLEIPLYKTNLRYLSVGQRKMYFGKCFSSAVFAKAENYRKKEQACKSVKKEQACKADLFHWARQNLTLPGRVRPSTIGELRLNFCVRYENRWIPQS